MKYVLIDGNNMACRCSFANDALTNSDGTPTGVHFGFFQSLITLKKRFSDAQYLIVWDSKSARRMAESTKGVTWSIIPEAYKENRRKDELPKPLKDFYSQHAYLQRGLAMTGIPQIKIDGYEADDVIASYCKALKADNEVFVVTSDRDYYQILDDNVIVFDGMKLETYTLSSFKKEMGITPSQYIDLGALCGDDGDNIFGIPGWGEKTALKELPKHGSWEKIIESYEKQYADLRVKYPDLHLIENRNIDWEQTGFKDIFTSSTDWAKVCNEMGHVKSDPTNPKSRLKYPGVYFGMPWSGVLLAFDLEKVKIPKATIMALVFQERVKLAYSLKKMDQDIPNLPAIEQGAFDREKLIQYFDYYDIQSLQDTIDILSGEVVNEPVGENVLFPTADNKEENNAFTFMDAT